MIGRRAFGWFKGLFRLVLPCHFPDTVDDSSGTNLKSTTPLNDTNCATDGAKLMTSADETQIQIPLSRQVNEACQSPQMTGEDAITSPTRPEPSIHPATTPVDHEGTQTSQPAASAQVTNATSVKESAVDVSPRANHISHTRMEARTPTMSFNPPPNSWWTRFHGPITMSVGSLTDNSVNDYSHGHSYINVAGSQSTAHGAVQRALRRTVSTPGISKQASSPQQGPDERKRLNRRSRSMDVLTAAMDHLLQTREVVGSIPTVPASLSRPEVPTENPTSTKPEYKSGLEQQGTRAKTGAAVGTEARPCLPRDFTASATAHTDNGNLRDNPHLEEKPDEASNTDDRLHDSESDSETLVNSRQSSLGSPVQGDREMARHKPTALEVRTTEMQGPQTSSGGRVTSRASLRQSFYLSPISPRTTLHESPTNDFMFVTGPDDTSAILKESDGLSDDSMLGQPSIIPDYLSRPTTYYTAKEGSTRTMSFPPSRPLTWMTAPESPLKSAHPALDIKYRFNYSPRPSPLRSRPTSGIRVQTPTYGEVNQSRAPSSWRASLTPRPYYPRLASTPIVRQNSA